jgi:hypothetical protein
MAEQTELEWPTCQQTVCIGKRLAAPARMCLAHASEQENAAALQLVGETGEIDARGVPVTPALLQRILNAAPRGEKEEPLIKTCLFNRATFRGDARFDRTTFRGEPQFGEAVFRGNTWFNKATFDCGAEFTRATFIGTAWFDESVFRGTAWFIGTTFGDAWFGRATFCRRR